VAYFAAGILNYDGVHVYALDAVTGKIKWQNNTSGHLDPESRTGVSVQGHLLLQDGRLYLAGGTSVSPAVYDIETGKCLNDSSPLELNRAASPRGQELYRLGEQVLVGGKPLYADPDYPVYDQTVFNKVLHSSAGNLDILWINSSNIACYERLDRLQLEKAIADPLIASFSVRGSLPKFSLLGKPLWERDCEGSMAFARSQNVVLFAGTAPHGLPTLEALDVKTGQRLWRQGVRLQSPPVPWGLAVDGKGRIVASLRDGQVMGFGPGTE
jgi:outer membrane protein assembly factor BamB